MLLKFVGIYFKALTAYGSELAQTNKNTFYISICVSYS